MDDMQANSGSSLSGISGRGGRAANDAMPLEQQFVAALTADEPVALVVLAVVGRQFEPALRRVWRDPSSPVWRGQVTCMGGCGGRANMSKLRCCDTALQCAAREVCDLLV